MKLVIRLFNLIYIVLAAVACVCLLTKPIVLIDASVGLEQKQITNLIYPSLKDQVTEDEWNDCIKYSLDDQGKFKVDLNLEIPSIQLFTKNADEVTQQLTDQVTKTFNQMVDKLKPTIKELAKVIAKKAAKDSIKDSIANQITTNSSDPSGDAYQIMADCNIDDEYIDNMTEDIFDTLLGDEEAGIEPVKTVDELMDHVDDYVADVCEKLANGGIEGYSTDPAERAEQVENMSDNIKTQLESQLIEAGLCDEDGNLVDLESAMDDLLATMLDQLFGTAEEETDSEESRAFKRVTMVNAEDSSAEEEESKLTLKIKEILNKKLEEFDLKGKITQYSFVPWILLAVLILPWAVFIVLTLIRTIRKTKVWSKPWVVFSFAFIQVILGVVLYLATAKFMTQLLGLLPDIDNPAIDILKNSTLSVKTGTFIPSILYIVMIPLSIVYVILCHKIKKEYKNNK